MNQYRKKDDKNNVLISTLIILGIFMILLLLFVNGKSFLKTSQRNSEIEEFQEENKRLADERQTSLEKLLYLESDQFKDKWAKERKNKINPGENVIVLPDEVNELFGEEFQNLSYNEQRIEILKNRPNREQWWEFFFGV